LKYFTNSFLNEYDIFKKARIGLEFEFYSKLSYGNTLEILNRKLGKKVFGFKEYHPDFKPTENEWMITPDFSGGINCVELITHPMEYSEARIMLVKIYRIIQEIGYTTERTGLHINISFDNKYINIEHINPIKLVLSLNEEYIYSFFPERENNIYCKSIKKIIPYKDYDFSLATSTILSSSLFLHSGISKYYGINFTCLNKGRIEFRYIGGTDYEWKINETLTLFDYFIKLCYDATTSPITSGETTMLRRYLEKNIAEYKSLSDLDTFITKFPSISLEVDRSHQTEIVKTFYPTFYDNVYDIVTQIQHFENCKLNFDTENRRIEIVGGHITCNGFLKNLIFIDCEIRGGDYMLCEFYDTRLKNVIINQSVIECGTVDDAKILECKVVKGCVLTDCYFSDGLLDCELKSGIFKSGKLGFNAVISDEVKMMNTDQNFFNLKKTEIGDGDKVIFNKKENK
jgi:hypothetical protein